MIRNLAPTTEQSYLYAVAQFSRHFGCSPDRLSVEEVRADRKTRQEHSCILERVPYDGFRRKRLTRCF